MSRRLNRQPGPKLNSQLRTSSGCKVQDKSIYFNFRYVTENKNHCFETVRRTGKDTGSQLFKLLTRISHSSWKELGVKGKNSGGFELLPVPSLQAEITEKIADKNISYDTKLHVFRFGNDRLVGLKAKRCKAVFHVLGFDWDCSLYDHG